MKHAFVLWVGMLLCIRVVAAEPVVIAAGHFGVDTDKKMIVVNQDVAVINAAQTQAISAFSIDSRSYTLSQPVSAVQTGVPYSVSNEGNSYTLYFTQLPLVLLSVSGNIVSDPKIPGTIVISESKNRPILSENIGIELRGSTAQNYPKKSYRFEFKDLVAQVNKDIAVLGMHADDDWNLQALYIEPLRLRNKTGFDIWRKINTIYYQDYEPEVASGPQMEYAELFLNGAYKGIYCVGEPVSRKLLKLKKYNAIDGIRGELYKAINWGGDEQKGNVLFNDLPAYSNGTTTWGGFEYKYPDEIASNWKNLYDFVDFVMNTSDAEFQAAFSTKFYLDNAVDYYIFLNLLHAWDNRGKNVYMAKYKAREPYFYVPWDLDGIFGIHWDGSEENNVDELLTNGMFNRLMKNDPDGINSFKQKLKYKWNLLRNDWVTHAGLMELFQTNYDYLNSNAAYARETLAGNYTHNETQMTYLSNWIEHRLGYLDAQFNADIDPDDPSALPIVHEEVRVTAYNLNGIVVKTTALQAGQLSSSFTNDLLAGIYILHIQHADFCEVRKVVVQ